MSAFQQEQVKKFKGESTKLVDDLRSLREALQSSQSRSVLGVHRSADWSPQSDKSVARSANEAISQYLCDQLKQAIDEDTTTMQTKIQYNFEQVGTELTHVINSALETERIELRKVVQDIEPQSHLSGRIDAYINQMNEKLRAVEHKSSLTMASEKQRLEDEYRQKFDDYKAGIDAYVEEIVLKFQTKAAEQMALYESLSAKLAPVELPKAADTRVSGPGHFCDEGLQKHVEKVRRLWEVTDPAKEDIAAFLAAVEKTLFLGGDLHKLYESEAKKLTEKLPIVQAIAKLEFLKVRKQFMQADDLEQSIKEMSQTYASKFGEQIRY